jgi:secreted trypsin-like serine protease
MKIAVCLFFAFVACNVIERTPQADVKIAGGQTASNHAFPHQVAIFKSGKFACSGTIIAKRFVLTAAKCVKAGALVNLNLCQDLL